MGTHFGSTAANGLTGQVLDYRHPQNRKAKAGVESMLVEEKDSHTYKYGDWRNEQLPPEAMVRQLLHQAYKSPIWDNVGQDINAAHGTMAQVHQLIKAVKQALPSFPQEIQERANFYLDYLLMCSLDAQTTSENPRLIQDYIGKIIIALAM